MEWWILFLLGGGACLFFLGGVGLGGGGAPVVSIIAIEPAAVRSMLCHLDGLGFY